MGYVQARFDQHHNRLVRPSGPLWQSRYKAKPVEDERQPLQMLAYIHPNSVAAHVVTEPQACTWSGHRELIGKAPARPVDVDATLGLLGPTVRAVRRVYVGVIAHAHPAPWLSRRLGRLPWWGEEPDRCLATPHRG